MDWSTFYVATATAAATLIGLLFIAVQFNIDAIAGDAGGQWRAIARSTFSFFLLLFLVPLSFLMPGLDDKARAYILWIAFTFGTVRALVSWIPVWRGMLRDRRERLWQTAWLLIAPGLVYFSLFENAREIFRGSRTTGVDVSIALDFIFLFAIALRNSWSLLVELTFERKRRETKGS